MLNASAGFNVSRADIGALANDWFSNDNISCHFVMNKYLWPYKNIFFLLCYWAAMMICVHAQNKSDRESFYQIYSSNKEKFQVRLALRKALEKQHFSDEQYSMIKACLIKEEAGANDPLFDLHIDQKLLEVGKVLGRGAQGVVLKGNYKGAAVAVKTLINVDTKEVRRQMFI